MFTEYWIITCGSPETLLTDNVRQSTAHFFRLMSQILGFLNLYMKRYYQKCNEKVERFKCFLVVMLRCYPDENLTAWYHYAPIRSYAYKMASHRSTGTTLFDLVLGDPPPEFTSDQTAHRQSEVTTSDRREDYVQRLQV